MSALSKERWERFGGRLSTLREKQVLRTCKYLMCEGSRLIGWLKDAPRRKEVREGGR